MTCTSSQALKWRGHGEGMPMAIVIAVVAMITMINTLVVVVTMISVMLSLIG
jgi:hypothetical protein